MDLESNRPVGALQSQVDDIAAEYISPNGPGMSLLLARNGEVLVKSAYGLADVSGRVPITPGTRFVIASATKQFTCAAMMLLKMDQKLEYDETIDRFFPGFPEWTHCITIRQLMNHTSGIPEYLTEAFWQEAKEKEVDLSDVLDRIGHFTDLEFEPGENHRYSNSGYVLLGEIVERVSGTTFASFLKHRVFEPLGMNDTLVGTEPGRYERQAVGYLYRGPDDFEQAPYGMSVVGWADGNIISTVEDLYRWDQALYSEALLPRSYLREAFTPVTVKGEVVSRYGFGWLINKRRGLDEIWHAGGTVGYSSRLMRFADQNATIVFLTNASGVDPHGDLVGALAEALLRDCMDPVPERIALPARVLEGMSGDYVDALVSKRDRGRVCLKRCGNSLLISQDSSFAGGLRLVPVDDDVFRVDNRADDYVRFLRRDCCGAVTGLRYLANGAIYPMRKL